MIQLSCKITRRKGELSNERTEGQMNHLSTSIEQRKQIETNHIKRHPRLIEAQMNDMVLAYQRIKKLSQRIEENEMTMQLTENQIRFMDLFESQCDQLKKEVTQDEFTAFELRYLEIPRKQKTYAEIAPLTGHGEESGSRKTVKRVRLKFLKQLVESGLEMPMLYQPIKLNVSDLLQAYEGIKKNPKNRDCRSKSKEGGGMLSFSTIDGACF